MKPHRISLGCLLLAVFLTLTAPMAPAQKSCENLAGEKIPNVKIRSAAFMNDPLGFPLPETPGVFGTPPGLKVSETFCRVIGHASPVPDSRIGFEVWLPATDKWNNRFLMTGNPPLKGRSSTRGWRPRWSKGMRRPRRIPVISIPGMNGAWDIRKG